MLPPKSRKRAARRLILVFVALLACGVLITWLALPTDPLYNGKHLSEHLYDSSPGSAPILLPPVRLVNPTTLQILADNQNSRRSEAEQAIRALGPRAIPLLKSWFESSSSPRVEIFGQHDLKSRLRKIATAPRSRFRWVLQWRWLNSDLHAIAYDALSRIPEHGAPLIPMLRKKVLSGDNPASSEAAQLFARIFNALPPAESARLARQNADLINLWTSNPNNQLTGAAVQVMGVLFQYDPPADAEAMVRRLWPFRTQSFNTTKWLISQLDSDGFLQNMIYLERGTSFERPAAALYFRDSPRATDRIVPLLLANLTPGSSINLLQNTCEALGAYGTNATAALPMLSNLVAHRKPYVALAASNGIVRISASEDSLHIVPTTRAGQ